MSQQRLEEISNSSGN